MAPPFKEAYFDIMYGQGISKWGELVDMAVQMDIIQKSGSWFSMGDERIGQGANSVKEYLQSNPEIAERVEAQVRENLLNMNSSAAKAPAKAAEKAVAVSADAFSDEDCSFKAHSGPCRPVLCEIRGRLHHAALPPDGTGFLPLYRP